MKRPLFLIVALVILFILTVTICPGDALSRQDQKKEKNSRRVVRQPVVSGSFYPSNPIVLRKMINGFLNAADPPEIKGKLIGLVEPHAGYVYSGGVAAEGYSLLKGRKFKTVVVIGPSHHLRYPGASIYNIGDYKTPLGVVRVDRKLCNRIIDKGRDITYYAPLHRNEHSVEVEIPFLQVALEDFSLVPIVMGEFSLEACQKLASALIKACKGKDVLFIASSDMSHYHEYSMANLIDEKANRIIEEFSSSKLWDNLASRDVEMCGGAPALTVMMVAKGLGADKAKVLKYVNSGDITGDKSRVVGYSAVAFFAAAGGAEEGRVRREENATKDSVDNSATEDAGYLSEEAREELLKIARETIISLFDSGKIPKFDVKNEELKREGGVFVTLRYSGRLRGCIGNFRSKQPLYMTVSKMAIQATRDYRFTTSPVTKQELNDIDIEISVLSPLRKIKSIDEIEMGKHGIYIMRGRNNGCFLPQVADETGWTKIEFLEHCCSDKAGLSPDAWKKKGTEILIFTAEVFGEQR